MTTDEEEVLQGNANVDVSSNFWRSNSKSAEEDDYVSLTLQHESSRIRASSSETHSFPAK